MGNGVSSLFRHHFVSAHQQSGIVMLSEAKDLDGTEMLHFAQHDTEGRTLS
jgi:hypothetical protein